MYIYVFIVLVICSAFRKHNVISDFNLEDFLNCQIKICQHLYHLRNMIVLNSRDRSEIMHIFEISHFKKQSCKRFTQKATLIPSIKL